MKAIPIVAAVALAAGIMVTSDPASAQVAPTVTDGGVTNSFPDGMHFAVSAESDSPIQELKLRYKILPDGTAAIGRPDFDASSSAEIESGCDGGCRVDLGGAGLY